MTWKVRGDERDTAMKKNKTHKQKTHDPNPKP